MHLIGWEEVCKPQMEGGLGIRRNCDVNKALLSKWLWCFGNKENSLGRRVINGKYGAINKWGTNRETTSQGVSPWKGIMVMANQLKGATHMEVGNGRNVLLWEDIWCCPRPLRLEFPTIFNIAVDKDASVADN